MNTVQVGHCSLNSLTGPDARVGQLAEVRCDVVEDACAERTRFNLAAAW